MFKSILAALTLGLSIVSTVSGNNVEIFKTTDDQKVTMVVAGDNLIHKPVITAGVQEDGSRDYNYMYSEISDYIDDFDIRVINQETPFTDDPSQYSGYPMFGSPTEIGDAVVDAGFNVVTQATNHTIDKGVHGVEVSHDFWVGHDIPVLGIHTSEESPIWFYEHDGILVAMLNYTYGLNGLTLPDGKGYMVDTFDNKTKIVEDLAYAEKEADITVVFAHWGIEYVYEPSAWQKDMAQFLADNGADLIIGAHPHVVEPLEILQANGKDVPVFWSLGNFISGQSEAPRMLGALAEVTIRKDSDGETYVESAKATPVVTHISTYSEQFKSYLLDDYTEELAATHRLRRTRGTEFSLSNLWNLWDMVMGDATYVRVTNKH